jgi:transcriptional regulator with XRE-family HTH domain
MIKQKQKVKRKEVLQESSDLGRQLAAQLITLRRRRGFASASEAARNLGVEVHTYLHYERGTRDMRLAVLDRILAGFDATLLELLGLPPGRPNRPGAVGSDN